MSTYEGCCCCTYDLQHSPSWLLLLLLIVDQSVYHAVLLLCHIYHPAHVMRLYDEHVLEVFRFFFSAQTCTNIMYEDCCLLLYLNMSTYEYHWCCWCCCAYRVVPYDPLLVVASFVATLSRSCC